MKKIAICHQKGGVVKSPLVQGLSLELPGLVAIFDGDKQGSTVKWLERREASTPFQVVGPVSRLPDLVAAAEKQNCDWFLIDTPPDHQDESNIWAAMSAADFVVLPTKMSRFDLEILPKRSISQTS